MITLDTSIELGLALVSDDDLDDVRYVPMEAPGVTDPVDKPHTILRQAHYVACIKRDKALQGVTLGAWTKPDPKQWQQLWRKS